MTHLSSILILNKVYTRGYHDKKSTNMKKVINPLTKFDITSSRMPTNLKLLQMMGNIKDAEEYLSKHANVRDVWNKAMTTLAPSMVPSEKDINQAYVNKMYEITTARATLMVNMMEKVKTSAMPTVIWSKGFCRNRLPYFQQLHFEDPQLNFTHSRFNDPEFVYSKDANEQICVYKQVYSDGAMTLATADGYVGYYDDKGVLKAVRDSKSKMVLLCGLPTISDFESEIFRSKEEHKHKMYLPFISEWAAHIEISFNIVYFYLPRMPKVIPDKDYDHEYYALSLDGNYNNKESFHHKGRINSWNRLPYIYQKQLIKEATQHDNEWVFDDGSRTYFGNKGQCDFYDKYNRLRAIRYYPKHSKDMGSVQLFGCPYSVVLKILGSSSPLINESNPYLFSEKVVSLHIYTGTISCYHPLTHIQYHSIPLYDKKVREIEKDEHYMNYERYIQFTPIPISKGLKGPVYTPIQLLDTYIKVGVEKLFRGSFWPINVYQINTSNHQVHQCLYIIRQAVIWNEASKNEYLFIRLSEKLKNTIIHFESTVIANCYARIHNNFSFTFKNKMFEKAQIKIEQEWGLMPQVRIDNIIELYLKYITRKNKVMNKYERIVQQKIFSYKDKDTDPSITENLKTNLLAISSIKYLISILPHEVLPTTISEMKRDSNHPSRIFLNSIWFDVTESLHYKESAIRRHFAAAFDAVCFHNIFANSPNPYLGYPIPYLDYTFLLERFMAFNPLRPSAYEDYVEAHPMTDINDNLPKIKYYPPILIIDAYVKVILRPWLTIDHLRVHGIYFAIWLFDIAEISLITLLVFNSGDSILTSVNKLNILATLEAYSYKDIHKESLDKFLIKRFTQIRHLIKHESDRISRYNKTPKWSCTTLNKIQLPPFSPYSDRRLRHWDVDHNDLYWDYFQDNRLPHWNELQSFISKKIMYPAEPTYGFVNSLLIEITYHDRTKTYIWSTGIIMYCDSSNTPIALRYEGWVILYYTTPSSFITVPESKTDIRFTGLYNNKSSKFETYYSAIELTEITEKTTSFVEVISPNKITQTKAPEEKALLKKVPGLIGELFNIYCEKPEINLSSFNGVYKGLKLKGNADSEDHIQRKKYYKIYLEWVKVVKIKRKNIQYPTFTKEEGKLLWDFIKGFEQMLRTAPECEAILEDTIQLRFDIFKLQTRLLQTQTSNIRILPSKTETITRLFYDIIHTEH
jgi:hypothetical protein